MIPARQMLQPAEATHATRILLVEDHPAVRVGARRLIEGQHDMTVVAEADSAEEALGRLSRLDGDVDGDVDVDVDVAVVDYHLGAGRDGLALTIELKRRARPPRVLVYSAFADLALVVPAIVAGADGLLRKDTIADELCTAIRRVASGRHYLPAVTRSVAHAMAMGLEPDDRAMFAMLLHGRHAELVAERLGLSGHELTERRARILSSLERTPSSLLAGAGSPLDYERPQRGAGRWAV